VGVVADAISSVFEDTGINDALETVIDSVGDITQDLANTASHIVENISDYVVNIVEDPTKVFTDPVQSISDAFALFDDVVTQTATAPISKITSVLDDAIVQPLTEPVSKELANLDDTVNEVIPGGWATVAQVAMAFAAPGLGTALGSAMLGAGASTFAAATLGGAVMGAGTGALTASLRGGDPLKGALAGAAGGAFGGAVSYASMDIAASIVGGGDQIAGLLTLKEMATATGISVDKISNIVSNSVASGIAGAATGKGDVATLIGTSLVASGVGAYAGSIVKGLESVPGQLSSAVAAASSVASIGTKAALAGNDIGDAIMSQAPNLLANTISAEFRPAVSAKVDEITKSVSSMWTEATASEDRKLLADTLASNEDRKDEIYNNKDNLQKVSLTFNNLRNDATETFEELKANTAQSKVLYADANESLNSFNSFSQVHKDNVAAFEQAKTDSKDIDAYLVRTQPDQYRIREGDGEDGHYKFLEKLAGYDGESGSNYYQRVGPGEDSPDPRDAVKSSLEAEAKAFADKANAAARDAKAAADTYNTKTSAYKDFIANKIDAVSTRYTQQTNELKKIEESAVSINERNKKLVAEYIGNAKTVKELEDKYGKEIAQQITDEAEKYLKTEKEAILTRAAETAKEQARIAKEKEDQETADAKEAEAKELEERIRKISEAQEAEDRRVTEVKAKQDEEERIRKISEAQEAEDRAIAEAKAAADLAEKQAEEAKALAEKHAEEKRLAEELAAKEAEEARTRAEKKAAEEAAALAAEELAKKQAQEAKELADKQAAEAAERTRLAAEAAEEAEKIRLAAEEAERIRINDIATNDAATKKFEDDKLIAAEEDRKRRLDEKTKPVENPDGTYTYTYPDGSTIKYDKDGNALADTATSPPGLNTYQIGDQTDAPPGTKFTLEDGTIGVVSPSGKIVPEGTVSELTPVVDRTGTVVLIGRDSTSITGFRDSNGNPVNKEGDRVNEDGSPYLDPNLIDVAPGPITKPTDEDEDEDKDTDINIDIPPITKPDTKPTDTEPTTWTPPTDAVKNPDGTFTVTNDDGSTNTYSKDGDPVGSTDATDTTDTTDPTIGPPGPKTDPTTPVTPVTPVTPITPVVPNPDIDLDTPYIDDTTPDIVNEDPINPDIDLDKPYEDDTTPDIVNEEPETEEEPPIGSTPEAKYKFYIAKGLSEAVARAKSGFTLSVTPVKPVTPAPVKPPITTTPITTPVTPVKPVTPAPPPIQYNNNWAMLASLLGAPELAAQVYNKIPMQKGGLATLKPKKHGLASLTTQKRRSK
jgi:hypothetical protein